MRFYFLRISFVFHSHLLSVNWTFGLIFFFFLKITILPAVLAERATSLRLTQRLTHGTMNEMADEIKRKMPASQNGTS